MNRALMACALLAFVTSGCAFVQRVSVADGTGAQAENGNSDSPAISADGRYIAFSSRADNLVADGDHFFDQIYVRDTVSGSTRKVSTTAAGDENFGSNSVNPAISGDGRYVAFESAAMNFPGFNSNYHVYVKDTVAGTLSQVDVSNTGAVTANGISGGASISADGRYVAFNSAASNLVTGDTNGGQDVFVRDTVAGTTTRVSVDSAEAQANGYNDGAAISADGHDIAFYSEATNLVSGDTNAVSDVFVRDSVAGTTSRVSVDGAGGQVNGASRWPTISADGGDVAFSSEATNLVSGDTNAVSDVFVRDSVAGTTSRVSVDSAGAQANGESSFTGGISGNGRYVVFPSEATNLVTGDTNAVSDIFVRDTVAGTTSRANLSRTGTQANKLTIDAVISTDGRYVAFSTDASNLVAGDTNGTPPKFQASDVFVRANPEPLVASVAPSSLARGTTTPVTITGAGFITGAVPVITGGGVTSAGVVVVNPTHITANVTVTPGAATGPRSLVIELPGTGPGFAAGAAGVCAYCVTVT